MVIYELFTGERDRPFPGRSYDRTNEFFCNYCRVVRRELYPHPIDIKLTSIPRAMNVRKVALRSIGIIHKRLLDRLAEYMTGFAFGDVYDMAGKKLPKYKTFYSAQFIRVRQPVESSLGQCLGCRRTGVYEEEGDRFFLKHELGSQHVYQDEICYTYVDEWLAARIDWSEFKDFELLPFPVLDRPPSGLRLLGDPDWSAMGPTPVEALMDQLTQGAGMRPAQPTTIFVPPPRRRQRTPSGARLSKKLRDRGLSAEDVTFLTGLARIGFKLLPASRILVPLSEVPIGSSRLGGLPDLPSGLEWPRSPDGRALAFLAQLNLADARGVGLEVPLPDTGQLYFFYDAETQPWGIDPADAGRWRVLLSEVVEADLRRTEPPPELAEEYRFDVRAVRLEPALFLPSVETLSEIMADWEGPAEWTESLATALSSGSYGEWVSQIHGLTEGEMDHRFLGHPHEVQSAMPGGLPAVTYPDATPDSAVPGAPSSFEGRAMPTSEWRLLLQLDTTGGPGWMWGDGGRLYFWIPRAELEARRFQTVWVELQCY